MSESQDAIRAARAAINEAIARRDAEAIGAFFAPRYHVTTARSFQYDGKEACVRGWANMLSRGDESTHHNVPEEIHVNEGWGMAEEHGRWTGTVVTRTGPLAVEGVYAAKWQQTPEGWLLQAEIFTPLSIETVARSESRGSGGTLL